MTIADHILALAVGVAWPLYGFLTYGAYREEVRRGSSTAKLAGYAEEMAIQWLFASLVVTLWIFAGRDFSALFLAWPGDASTWWAFGTASVVSLLLLGQNAVVGRRQETRDRVRKALEPAAEMLPVSRHDLTGFMALSVTAGICEELLFRGLLPWYFGHVLGAVGGQAASVVLFTLGHLYLGSAQAARAGLAGVALAALVLWSGSLLPAILLHAVIDIASGWMGYIVLRVPDAHRSPSVG